MALSTPRKILVWFRNDLRLHDNEVLVEAIAKADEILPVFFFDPRHFELTANFSIKTGAIRTQFLIESVAALRKSFQSFGGDLLVLTGKPEELLPDLVQNYEITEVYHHREVANEETTISMLVEDALWKLKVNLKHFIGHTLYNKEDLPFPIKDIPDVFSLFKKKTERDAIVKPCFLTPEKITFVEVSDWASIPDLAQLAVNEQLGLNTSGSMFKGGEQEALKHLDDFLTTVESLALANASTKKTEIISRLAPWLALGCLSPREVYWKMKGAEAGYLKPYFNQVILGLLWRDYYRFMFKKYGNTFFRPEGFRLADQPVSAKATKTLNNWKNGNTGQPLVDAAMLQLKATGYINTSSRFLVATYLVYELQVNWVLGAAYFEEKLIDYSPASNWGSWANVSGVGNDLKLTSSFDFQKQLKTMDPKYTSQQAVRV